MKNGKKINLNCDVNYKIHYGTLDYTNLKSIYINISSWGDFSNNGDFNYDFVMRNLKKDINDSIYYKLNPDIFDRRIIITDIDIKKSGLTEGKRTFMNCEITLFLIDKNNYPLDYFKSDVENIVSNAINIFTKCKYFTFYNKKHKNRELV